MAAVILPVPHRTQRTDGECLAACAEMVLAFMGLTATHDQLVSLLNVQWYDAPFFNIRLLEQIGVTVAYQQGTLAELREHLAANRPLIVPVATGELPYTHEQIQRVVGRFFTPVYFQAIPIDSNVRAFQSMIWRSNYLPTR